MALTTKESVPPASEAQENTTTSQSAPPAAPHTDPIGIEVPVVIHASRYSATTKGLNKPLPPVHEETRTVIVFAQGAVVRLSASLSLGETVVLTNLQTGADVLCRVAGVKAQTGIQNYVDLEFTQRAPGFWNRSSNGDAPVRRMSPVPEVASKPEPTPKPEPAPTAVPTLPTVSTIPLPATATAPLQQSAPAPTTTAVPSPAPSQSALSSPSISPPIDAALPSPPGPQPAPVERPSIATLGAQPELAARPSPAPKQARTSSSVVAGVSAGMRQARSGEQAVLGGGLDRTKESPARSRKGLIAAVTILAVAGLAGGAYVLTQRSVSGQPASGITTAAPSAPTQPPQAQADQTPAPAPAAVESAPAPTETTDGKPGPAIPDEKSLDAPRQTRREPAPADIAKQAPVQEQSVKQTPPLHPAVEVGSLRAPVLRNAAISGSSEPPPTLSAQDNSATRDVLASGGLAGAAAPSAPAPPVAFASPEPVKVGGQLQMPKVISSPQPAYPEIARSEGVQGTVVMDALIDATGTVSDVKVTSGPLVLRQAAMDALRRWKYQPARLNGQPTSVHMNVSINFTAH